jgi:hypothetical protein
LDVAWGIGGDLPDQNREPEYVVPGTVVVKTYGDYFAEYFMHVDAKMAGSDGRPAGPWTRGPLSPLHVQAEAILARVGKESKSDPKQPDTGHPTLYSGGRCPG